MRGKSADYLSTEIVASPHIEEYELPPGSFSNLVGTVNSKVSPTSIGSEGRLATGSHAKLAQSLVSVAEKSLDAETAPGNEAKVSVTTSLYFFTSAAFAEYVVQLFFAILVSA